MQSPSDMLLFAEVGRAGSFTAAAKRLGLTKQTVSERISRLEAALGVRLLERTTRRMSLTDLGARYHEHCVAVAERVALANAELVGLSTEPVGLVRVSVPVAYGRRYLLPVVARFMLRHPQIRVECLLTDRYVDLVAEGVHLAVRVGPLESSSLTARKLGEGQAYVVCSPSYIKRFGRPKLNQMPGWRCIGLRPQELWRVGEVRANITPVLVVNDLELCREAAIAGVGVARIPGFICEEQVRGGQLKVLFGPDPVSTPGIYLVTPSGRHLAAATRLLADEIAASFEPATRLDV